MRLLAIRVKPLLWFLCTFALLTFASTACKILGIIP